LHDNCSKDIFPDPCRHKTTGGASGAQIYFAWTAAPCSLPCPTAVDSYLTHRTSDICWTSVGVESRQIDLIDLLISLRNVINHSEEESHLVGTLIFARSSCLEKQS
jgi:hypothetical protein